VLDNIMTGRLNFMKTGWLAQSIWLGKAKKEENINRQKVEEIIDFLEIQTIRKTQVGRLPYGLKKRVELARALAAEPDLLLLDEPMAGMNVEEKEDMSRFILDVNDEFGTTIALIELIRKSLKPIWGCHMISIAACHNKTRAGVDYVS